jgi:hypothetical protein
MAKAVKDSDIAKGDPIYEAGIEQFEKNIQDVLTLFERENIPVYVSTIQSNLKGQAPLSDFKDALEAFQKGQELLEKNQLDSANAYFLKAKELDRIRFRAPEAINTAIKQLMKDKPSYLVDAATFIATKSEDRIPGSDLFTDHLHPTAEGHEIIADAIFNKMKAHPMVADVKRAASIQFSREVSLFEETYAEVQISRLLYGYPFVKGITADQERINYEQYYQSKLNESFIDSLAALTWRTQRQVSLSLTDVVNDRTSQQDSLSVMQHYLPLAYWQLFNKKLLQKGVNYAINNRKLDDYTALLIHLSLKNFPDELYFNSSLAALYLVEQDLQRAEYWLKRSEEIDQTDRNTLFNLARLYAIQKDSLKAREYFNRYRQTQ